MRASGILLPVSSLPGKYGIGCFSKEAYDFVDVLEKANQKYWQILPIGPTSYGDSPYQSFSTFAGNPYFISLEKLIEEELLTEEECNSVDFGENNEYIDYEKLYNGRFNLLKKAYKRSNPEDEGFKKFVEEKGYEPYLTSKYPDKKLAILTCMDTRLIELLPAALGIRNGDAKVIKNAGGVITHPYGSVMRSLLVAIVELGVEEVMVIGHTDCGVQGMNGTELLEDLTKRGVKQEHIDIIRHSGVDLETWLGGFESVEQSVEDTVYALQNHPLMPKDVTIRGFIMNSETGELKAVEEV